MGQVYADIELINGEDLTFMRRGLIGEDEVKRFPMNIMVDTGACSLCINENIQEAMQFPVVDRKKLRMANEEIVECDVVTSVELRFKNRSTTCRAFVLPGDSQPLLGAIPLEDLDVVIDPGRGVMMVNPEYPDMAGAKVPRITPDGVLPLGSWRDRTVVSGTGDKLIS